MQSPVSRRSRAATFASAAVLASVFAVPTVASATVTTTNVDAPAPDAVLEGTSFGPGAPGGLGPATLPVTGTAPGADPGDLVDLVCTVGAYGQVASIPLADDVPVGADGRFSALAPVPPYTCRLRAVPPGAVSPSGSTPASALAAFTGPRVLGGSFTRASRDPLRSASGGARRPTGETYLAVRGQRQGFGLAYGLAVAGGSGSSTLGGGMISSALVDDTDLRPVFGAVGFLAAYGTGPQVRRADDASLLVDGTPAQPVPEVDDQFSRVVTHELDPVTADLRIVETAPLAAEAEDGSGLQATGITMERTYVQDHDGRLFTFHDVFRSTDGTAHRVEARYSESMGASVVGPGAPPAPTFRVPWTTGDAYVTQPKDGAPFGPSPAGPATIYARTAPAPDLQARRAAGADDPDTDEAAFAFDSAPTDGAFLSPQAFVIRFVREVPADGAASVGHRYAQAATPEELRDILGEAPPAPGGDAAPLPAGTPLPQSPPVLPPSVLPTVPRLVNPLPRVASSTRELLLTKAQGVRLRDRKPVTVRVSGVPAGRYGIALQRFVRNGKVLARGTKTLSAAGDLAVTLRLTAEGREYFGLKRVRARRNVRTLVRVSWTPTNDRRRTRTGVYTTRFR